MIAHFIGSEPLHAVQADSTKKAIRVNWRFCPVNMVTNNLAVYVFAAGSALTPRFSYQLTVFQLMFMRHQTLPTAQ